MKKRYFKLLALALLVLMGTVACSNSSNSDLSSASPVAGTEVSSAGGKPSSTPASPGSGEEASPALPTPPLPPALILEKAHEEYAKFTETSLLGVQMCWKDAKDRALEDFSKSPIFFEDFLSFVYHVDPEVRSRLDYAKILVKKVHDAIAADNMADLWSAEKNMITTNQEIKKRILKAVEIYGIPVGDLFPVYSSADPVFAQLYGDEGLFSNSLRIQPEGSIFPVELSPEQEIQAKALFESITLVYFPSAQIFSLENFSTRKDLTFPLIGIVFPFEADQGGFGRIASDSVRFVN